jgi:xanthine dehydrogenase accessory factor
MRNLILIRGAGDLASGTALRLVHAGYSVVMTESSRPSSVRRAVCFSEAVYQGAAQVEELQALRVETLDAARNALAQGKVAVFVDPDCRLAGELKPAALIDAIMAKRNVGTTLNSAPFVVALGPGFYAGRDCHAVVETSRGHSLGRVITSGSALPNTGIPGDIAGHREDRIFRPVKNGAFKGLVAIGTLVKAGDIVAETDGEPVRANISGIVRGILPDGFPAWKGIKAGDVDPRGEKAYCFSVSDKALAIAGGVLEALLAGGVLP